MDHKNQVSEEESKGKNPYQEEIILVITVVLSLLSLFSILGIGGIAGKWLRTFLFGTMGMIGYLFPFLLFFTVVFILSNYHNWRVLSKIFCCIGICFVLMGLLQMIFYGNEEVTIPGAYLLCAKSTLGGGFFGALFSIPLVSLVGTAGAYVIFAAIILILVMFISSRFLFSALNRSGQKKLETMRRQYQAERMERTILRESYGELPPRKRRPSVTFDLREDREEAALAQEIPGTVPAGGNPPLTASEEEVKKPSRKKSRKKAQDMQEYTPSVEESAPITQNSDEIKKELEQSILPVEDVKEQEAIPFRPAIRFVDGKESGYVRKELPEPEVDFVDYSKDQQKTPEIETPAPQETEKFVPQEPQRAEEFMQQKPKKAEEAAPQESERAEKHMPQTYPEIEYSLEQEWETGSMVAEQALSYAGQSQLQKPEKTGNQEQPENSEQPEPSKQSENPEQPENLKQTEPPEQSEQPEPPEQPVQRPPLASGSFERFTKERKFDGSVLEGTGEEDIIPQAGAGSSLGYVFPPINLLAAPAQARSGMSSLEIQTTTEKLRQTFESFKVRVRFGNVSCGPAVTRYEIQPEQGVKVSKITNLADDIKLTLAAPDIRIEAPIPGKAAIGIEVPNKETSPVLLRELLESDMFKAHKSKIAFAVGRDIAGQPVVTDIAKMPHLLIAGATGSGKSVCINTLIMSILYKANPDDVKLIMVDPKVVELSVYNGIPHLMIPVVTDPKKASAALNWAVMEMTDRYGKFAELGVRDLNGYNKRIAQAKELASGKESEKYKKLPQIIIIVDELADLMMVAPGEVEDAICRLAQMARAAGLHLVIATQRPSVNVITGVIKANVPSRIAFSVSSAVDSRTIIDGVGAEKLLGKGDMLFFPSGLPKPIRVQGAFVSDTEVSRVVEFLREQNQSHSYDSAVSEKIDTAADFSSGAAEPAAHDEYFAEAGRFIIEKDKASIGMLQRVYKIGFNRAARIMDQLADAGVVGPEEGTKPRKILMSKEEFEQYIEERA